MPEVKSAKNFNRLSASARKQREGDIDIQKKAMALVREQFPSEILDVQLMRDDITVTIEPDILVDLLTLLKNNEELRFNMLSSITGVDYSRYEIPEGWGNIRFGAVYNLFSIDNRANFAVRVVVPEEEPVIPSVYDLWNTADWQEREIYDLFGVEFSGHPDLRRLFLYDDFESEYPLRKEYPLKGKGERDISWLKVQKQARGEDI